METRRGGSGHARQDGNGLHLHEVFHAVATGRCGARMRTGQDHTPRGALTDPLSPRTALLTSHGHVRCSRTCCPPAVLRRARVRCRGRVVSGTGICLTWSSSVRERTGALGAELHTGMRDDRNRRQRMRPVVHGGTRTGGRAGASHRYPGPLRTSAGKPRVKACPSTAAADAADAGPLQWDERRIQGSNWLVPGTIRRQRSARPCPDSDGRRAASR